MKPFAFALAVGFAGLPAALLGQDIADTIYTGDFDYGFQNILNFLMALHYQDIPFLFTGVQRYGTYLQQGF